MKQQKVIPWLLGGFLAPPVVWLFFGWYFEIWNLAELTRIIVSPYIWSYVALFVALVTFMILSRLRRIDAYLAGARGAEVTARAQRSVNAIPWIFVGVMTVYCVIGPNVALLGQTLNDPFLDRTEYLLAELLAIPIILLFTIPFFMNMVVAVERRAQDVALHDNRRFLSLRGKVSISVILNLIGGQLTIVIAALSFVYERTTTGGVAFDELVSTLAVTGAVVLAIGLTNVFLLLRQIVHPVNTFSRQLAILLRKISQGNADLTNTIRIASRDEIGYLARNFQLFILSLRRLIMHIQESLSTSSVQSTELANSSATSSAVLANADESSNRIAVQFTRLNEELESAVTRVRDVAGFVQSVSERISRQTDAVRKASNTTTTMSEAMSSLAEESVERARSVDRLQRTASAGEEQMKSSMSAIERVSESAGSIEKATAVIDDIAQRTHLLAMNAAIQAAKAGDNGSGFAVVAREIKDLAGNTQQNSQEISESLKAVTESIESARETTIKNGEFFSEILGIVGEVTELIRTSAARLQDVAAKGRTVTESLQELESDSHAVDDQARSMSSSVQDIVTSLSEVQSVSESTRSTVDEIAGNLRSLGQLIANANRFIETNEKSVGVLDGLVRGFTVSRVEQNADTAATVGTDRTPPGTTS